VNSVSVSIEDKLVDITCLGDQGIKRLSGLEDSKVTIGGFFDSTIDALITSKIGGTAEAWIYYPQGTATGKRTITGAALIESYESPASPDAGVTFTLNLANSGTITYGTVAA